MKRFIALALVLPTPLLAQEPPNTSYDYFDFNYMGTTWDTGPADVDGNGYSGRFSVVLRKHLFLLGEYSAWDFDNTTGGSTSTSLGMGSNWGMGDKFSVYGTAGFRSLDLDIGTGNLEEETAFVGGGVRWQIAEGFELRAGADYADLSPARSGVSSVSIGGDIYLTNVVTLSLEVNQNEDESTTALIGVRFYHKKDPSNLRQRR